MKKWSCLPLLLLVMSRPLQADGVTAYHKLKPGETMWFVAQIYYDDGNQFKRILEANHMLKAEDVVADQELLIPNPKWLETMPEFTSHYEKLGQIRNVALEKMRSAKHATYLAKHKAPVAHPAASAVVAMPESKVDMPRQGSNVEK